MEVHGGEVLVFGDLHFSDVFTGKHKDYLVNCTDVLGRITKLVNEREPKIVVFLGDLVGWNETNIKNREILSLFCEFFMKLKTEKIYVLRGNHDMKGYPDYQFLLKLGIVEEIPYFDYYGNNGLDTRFHFVNYGEETQLLDIVDQQGVSNVVFAHNNFTVEGMTTWYADHDGIELASLQSFGHVDMVVSGHIHNPSPELIEVDMYSGQSCYLFYPGCPTRPIKLANNYDMCWAMSFRYNSDKGCMDFDMIPYDLTPCTELYYGDDEYIEDKSPEELEDELRKEQLADVLSDIIKYRMVGGDLMQQIENIPNASDGAKKVAREYLQVAYNNSK